MAEVVVEVAVLGRCRARQRGGCVRGNFFRESHKGLELRLSAESDGPAQTAVVPVLARQGSHWARRLLTRVVHRGGTDSSGDKHEHIRAPYKCLEECQMFSMCARPGEVLLVSRCWYNALCKFSVSLYCAR
jgi:hypothetical protein